MIDPKFSNINRLVALAFENLTNKASFSNFCLPKVFIRNYNVTINGINFIDQTAKKKNKKRNSKN